VLNTNDVHVAVYRVLDEVFACSSIPPGAKGSIFAVIDKLQRNPAQSHELRKAEEISLALHGLEAALRRSDQNAAKVARQDLQSLATAWINMRVSIYDSGAKYEN
jgi:hypothetical protein